MLYLYIRWVATSTNMSEGTSCLYLLISRSRWVDLDREVPGIDEYN